MNKAKLIKYLLDIRASYWFIPTLMVLAAVLLSFVTIWIDTTFDDWPAKASFFSNDASGARAVLSSIAGSMITVAGVTFSLTLLALSHATAQFGPRLLNNFMRDRGNQFTFGTLVATFIYCLLILRTVRSAPVSSNEVDGANLALPVFVPHIATSVAILLALFSVAVLIYFIHHVPESIRLSNVVSTVGHKLCQSIKEIFPETIAEPWDEVADASDSESADSNVPEDFFESADSIQLEQSGYLQSVDEEKLLSLSAKLDTTIFLKHRPGDFYVKGTELIAFAPVKELSDHDTEDLKSVFALGTHRTLSQNTLFAVDQLVEVAQRALSPGVNDPMTAMYCMDWLKAGLVELTARNIPSPFRSDSSGNLRVFSKKLGFEEFCFRILGQLRPYVARDFNASLHMIKMIKFVQRVARRQSDKEILESHIRQLQQTCENSGWEDFELDELRKAESCSSNEIPTSMNSPRKPSSH